KQNVYVKWKETTKVKFENKLKKATIFTITKSGEVFYGVRQVGNETYGTMHQPVYKSENLAGAVYEIKAAADIVTDDGKKYYSQGDIVDTITTGADGVAKSKQLYLGKYTITETKAPAGMVLNPTPQTITLTTANQTVALSETKVSFVNDRQKLNVSLDKVLEKNDTFNIGNADEIKNVVFGLYATEAIKSSNGNTIPKDGLIEVMTVAEGGKVTVKSDLPFGKYYVKEIATDEHYVLGAEKFNIDFSYQGQSKKVVDLVLNSGKAYENKLIYGSVNGVKVDEYNNKLGGAVIGLFKADETTFTEATAILKTTSGSDGSFKFEKLPYGSYIVREIKQPTGFVISHKSFPVVISANEQVVDITMENRHIKGKITLTKIDEDFPENKLTGATFEVYKDVNGDGKIDSGDKLIGNLEENNEGIYDMKELDYGKYLVRETKAPVGFVLDTGVYSVNITEDNSTYAVENKAGVGFINKAMKGSLKIVKRSSDNKVDGFSFRVTGVDGYDEVFTTDENGIINITGLRIGEYKVSEVEDTASNSYILPDDQTIEIEYNKTAEVQMYNKLKDVPKTGDNSNMPLWFGIGGISLAGIGAAVF
ncbi:MAG: collagen binding domain-containing protein, partial [Acutalibacteraceae bacterium]